MRKFKLYLTLCIVIAMVVGCGQSNAKQPVTSENIGSSEDANVTSSTEPETTTEEPTTTTVDTSYDFTFCFAGDTSLADDAVTMKALADNGNDLSKVVSPELLKIMNDADVMCINSEFTFTTRGQKIPGKLYHFRANPEKVSIYKEMGVDLAMLANNHAYDFGEVSLLDTIDTLAGADIDYFGAGKNLAEAMKPVYYEIDGKTIAFVSASRAEKNKKTPQATEDGAGILRCYDTELFLQVIKEADANADFVIACVHWGTEYSTVLEDVQLQTGKEYLDAGADVIVGSHSHCLQGMEYYKGKPIIYSLGNYWFNNKTLDSMLLQLRFHGDDDEQFLEVSMVPAIQSNSKVQIVTDKKEQERIYKHIEKISINIEIDENGVITEKGSAPTEQEPTA